MEYAEAQLPQVDYAELVGALSPEQRRNPIQKPIQNAAPADAGGMRCQRCGRFFLQPERLRPSYLVEARESYQPVDDTRRDVDERALLAERQPGAQGEDEADDLGDQRPPRQVHL